MVELLIVVTLFWVVPALSSKAFAVSPDRQLAQYAHHRWQVGDAGLFGDVTALSQSKDGHLLVATAAGLETFDGLRFRAPRPGEPNYAAPATVYDILTSRAGDIYLREATSVVRISQGRATDVTPPQHLIMPDGQFAQTRDGQVLATGIGPSPAILGFCRVDTHGFTCPLSRDQRAKMPDLSALSIAASANGDIWLGGLRSMYRLAPGGEITTFPVRRFNSVAHIAIDDHGTVWVGYDNLENSQGLLRWSGTGFTAVKVGSKSGRALHVTSLMTDRNDSLWIGTLDDGLYRITGTLIDHFGPGDGLSGKHVAALFEDREGSIWAATENGLDQFTDQPVIRYAVDRSAGISVATFGDRVFYATGTNVTEIRADGSKIKVNPVSPSHPDLWPTIFTTDDGMPLAMGGDQVWRLTPRGFHLLPEPDGRTFDHAWFGGTDLDGGLWIASDELAQEPMTNLLWHYTHGRMEGPWSPGPGTMNHSFTVLRADGAGGVWIAPYSHGLVHFADGRFKRIDAISENALVTAIQNLRDRTMLVATAQGLFELDGDRSVRLNDKLGLPCLAVNQMIVTLDQAMWLVMPCGLVYFDKAATRNLLDGAGKVKPTAVMGPAAGYVSGTPARQAAATNDGTLWYVSDGGLFSVNPKRLTLPGAPPIMAIDRITADGKPITALISSVLPTGTRRLDIEYSGVSLVQSSDIHFRYRLLGYDRDWMEVGAGRQASYTNLRPGEYQFAVVGCAANGMCSAPFLSRSMVLPPTFTQTRIFWVALFLLACLILRFAYGFRVHQIRRQVQLRLGERLAERERISRDLHDTLLQGFQGTVLALWGLSERTKRALHGNLQDDAIPADFEKALSRAETSLIESRSKIRDLREKESDDLAYRIERVVQSEAEGGGPAITIAIDGVSHPIHPITCEELVGISREAIANAVQHAQAQSIAVRITYAESKVSIAIQDDGIGIDRDILKAGGRHGHFGLPGMRERASLIGATILISSDGGRGTKIEVGVPGNAAYSGAKGSKSIFGKMIGFFSRRGSAT